MKTLLTSIALIAAIGCSSAAFAAEESHDLATKTEHAVAGGHFPVIKPEEQSWSFAGPFGKYDKGQLQRGLKVYKEVCSACHSMSLVSFRTLGDLGYSEDQVKAFAAEYEVQDGPNADGEMYSRKAVPSDHFPSPFPNHEAAAAANGGAAPPDMSLLAKARGVERGFPQFIIDMIPIIGGYQEGGPDYIHALLTGYQDAPAGVEVSEGTHFNPYFVSAVALKMAPPISADQVTYDDGAPQTVDQYSKDVSAFLMWAAEPHLEQRKRTGFMVMVFLFIFTALIYLTKKSIYANKEH
ncbi:MULTISPECIES: cytochrome c1 [Rhizobium/Agrobacterium group]|uniref:Cytochrome c1 n=2 Tax=Rhizobium/Agrobacterium group TaxID=227290 RepID=A0A546XL77_RHIRH|nr:MULTISPECIES: cytochrome c1 [Rhizobium/Agrobacterium group]MCZ7471429.1 cytochrome c1 [Rhizobium rhizogenes]MCZ7480309.1 cytochrome c1 [Rhizobium rhizogenes]MCZ7486534.1 cytochrome c1 [Rhizobium rhizogenes]MDA5634064.1 cytochrome c1 [Agrobacterium sp. ST15.16.024]MDF1889579.1 cytochrome c1 [Rhizobium rhizogenes]